MTDASCSCCGQSVANTLSLGCHPEIAICFQCLDWLNTKRDEAIAEGTHVVVRAVDPIFSVADVPRALAHYERLGFETEKHDDTYAFALRDDVTIHLTHSDRFAAHGVVYLHVDNADVLAAAWRAAGVAVTELIDTDYGKREGSHTDQDGNLIRFGSPLSD
ncbi:MAG: VOC family protein [Actinomycetota bacterium]